MYKHILVPTDGSPLSQAAAVAAVKLAHALGARITGFFAAPAATPVAYDGLLPVGLRTPEESAALIEKVWRQRCHRRPERVHVDRRRISKAQAIQSPCRLESDGACERCLRPQRFGEISPCDAHTIERRERQVRTHERRAFQVRPREHRANERRMIEPCPRKVG